MKIKDSIVLVTGANRGFAFTQVLLEMGAKKVYAAALSLTNDVRLSLNSKGVQV
ncbi:hypothetical protein [Clostridium drakei]|uniref:hypothetical protein n=1 Tax=Clostridium drakei TaxID=332101 RepID=UPI000A486B3D|nr:hypothetical protein [Clostridium drakei]